MSLDVGAGGGSISQWLCDRVGPEGSVVAVDADTRFLDSGGAPPQAMQQVERFNRFGLAFLEAASKTGWDLTWAPNLPQRLSALGLEDVTRRTSTRRSACCAIPRARS